MISTNLVDYQFKRIVCTSTYTHTILYTHTTYTYYTISASLEPNSLDSIDSLANRWNWTVGDNHRVDESRVERLVEERGQEAGIGDGTDMRMWWGSGWNWSWSLNMCDILIRYGGFFFTLEGAGGWIAHRKSQVLVWMISIRYSGGLVRGLKAVFLIVSLYL